MHFITLFDSEPLQSIGESHLLGYKHGQRNGDVVASTLNYQFYLQVIYVAGPHLSTIRDKCREFAIQLVQRKQQFLLRGATCLYLQAVAMIHGLGFKEEGNGTESLPEWADMTKTRTGAHLDFSLIVSVMNVYVCKLGLYKHMHSKGVLMPITHFTSHFSAVLRT